MLWQVTVASTELRLDLNQRSTDQKEPIPWPVEPVSLVPRPVQYFGPENLYFSIIFLSNT